VARAVQAPIRGFTRVMRGPIRALNRAAEGILHLFGLEAREELASARTPDELLSLVRHSADEGTLPVGTATLLVRSLTFAEKHARDVITARPQMVTVAATDTVATMLAVVRTSGHSRLPVLGPRGLDDVVGVIELDQAVAVPVQRRGSVPVREVMAAAVEVPESLPLDAVLRALQTARTQLALVVDEYGGTAGVLTGEDLLEELVGEVEDEHDTPVPQARRVAGGFDVSGLLRPDEVRAATGFTLPEHGVYETVGGLVMRELGRLPVAGDRLGVGDVELTVLSLDGRRVDRLLIASRPGEDA
jgi:CBS domain containing-hemolysin-like protein